MDKRRKWERERERWLRAMANNGKDEKKGGGEKVKVVRRFKLDEPGWWQLYTMGPSI
jgi:hypothetical protein